MQLTAMLDLYFPKQELTPDEVMTLEDDEGKFFIYEGQKFSYVMPPDKWARYSHKTEYSLYERGTDYLVATTTTYALLSVYDISDKAQVRKFLQAYIIEATDGEIHDLFNGLF